MRYLIIAIALLGVVLTSDGFAQGGPGWHGGQGWGHGGPYGRMYDPKTVETVMGEVLGVDEIIPHHGMGHGIHLRLRTAKETIAVHLGPSWYIEHQDTKIGVMDQLEVTGSRITFGGAPAIIAATVRKGNETLTLRDADGFPMWAGWRRRQ